MTKRKVSRWFCDFCRKGSFSSQKTARHEITCLYNPNRTPWEGELTYEGIQHLTSKHWTTDTPPWWPGRGKIYHNGKWHGSEHSAFSKASTDFMTNWITQLQSKRRKVYSQGGQDGIIEWIFQNIGTTNKVCVEFGFNSKTLEGGTGANVANLVLNHGWKPILFDSDNENPAINLNRAEMTYFDLPTVFARHEVPKEPDLVSIDVDSIDYWLMMSMLEAGYRPRVISVEYNSNFPAVLYVTVKQGTKWNNYDCIYGASITALDEVALQHGYCLVGVEPYLDAFFVRHDLLNDSDKSLAPTIGRLAGLTPEPIHHNPATEHQLTKLLIGPDHKRVTPGFLAHLQQLAPIFKVK